MTTRPKSFTFEQAWDMYLQYLDDQYLDDLIERHADGNMPLFSERLRTIQAAFQPLYTRYDGHLRRDEDRFMAMAAWEEYWKDPDGYEQANDKPLTEEEAADWPEEDDE